MFAKAPSVDVAAAKLVDSPSFTVLVAKYIKQEVRKNSLVKAKIMKRCMKLGEAVQKKEITEGDRVPT